MSNVIESMVSDFTFMNVFIRPFGILHAANGLDRTYQNGFNL